MINGKIIPLFDPTARPQVWSERMAVGEYAVHYSFVPKGVDLGPTCTIFPTLQDAEDHARAETTSHPALRCRIYSHEGLGLPPVSEIRGKEYRDTGGLSASFRRWTGSVFFFGGLTLLACDWYRDFQLSWPGTIGARLFPVGLILLLTEFVIVWGEKRKPKA